MKKVCLIALIVVLTCGFSFAQTYKVLWSFGGTPNDGANPISYLVFDKAGNMYGTTALGGSASNGACPIGSTPGCGTVFELSPNPDGTWTENVIYNFCAGYPSSACLDGERPTAGLAMDKLGNLYGTTYLGGVPCESESSGCGTVFELSPPQTPGGNWTESVLYSFCSGGDISCLNGALPNSQLTLDASGNLYGTTTGGGKGGGEGTVFELSPGSGGWTETVLYNFCLNGAPPHRCPDGAQPQAGVTFDKSGNLYGTTEWGGTPSGGGFGTVYELSPGSNGWTETVLVAFNPGGGEAGPRGVVSFDAAGNIYSTADEGGQSNLGGVFRLNRNSNTLRAVTFNGTSDGANPTSGVLIDQKTGTIYGTNTTGFGPTPDGVVLEIGKEGKITVLYAFCQQTNCADGAQSYSTPSVHSGNLFGTTQYGGIGVGQFDPGNGVVFEIVR